MTIQHEVVCYLAEEMWHKYCTTADPQLRRTYSIWYEFWANKRETYEQED